MKHRLMNMIPALSLKLFAGLLFIRMIGFK